MITIGQLLKGTRLPNSPSERLDLELLLAAALDKPKSYLYIWPAEQVSQEALDKFEESVARRQAGEPIAYILGVQGFWSLDLQVGPQTLIPRPDTELLVETCLEYLAKGKSQQVLDLGCGAGAIGLAIASERPAVQVTGVDFIESAVALSKQNAAHLKLSNISFLQSHWFNALAGSRFDIIVSNPPYIESDDPHLQQGDVQFEPYTALVSGIDGLDDIRLIIEQAPDYLLAQGWLFLEHGYQQAEAVRQLLIARGFSDVKTAIDLGGNERVTGGQWCAVSN